jgi:PadR family transcriptional regulator PadR
MRLTFTTVRVAQGLMADPFGVHWGYGLSQDLGIATGVLYPTLRRWERLDILASEWEANRDGHGLGRPPRRLYRLTPEGRKTFAALLRTAAVDKRFAPLFA